MRRRAFIALLGGATASWPMTGRAQQAGIPVIGFFRSSPAAPFASLVVAFRQGLSDMGFVEGQNVAIEQRWGDNQLERLPGLAADLVRRRVSVIVGNSLALDVARKASSTIPMVFVIGDDPVSHGLVASLNRPGGNLTGLTFFGNRLGAKRLEMLLELVPGTRVIAVLVDPNFGGAAEELREVERAALSIGRQVVVARAGNEDEFNAAFVTIVQAGAGALVVSGSSLFSSHTRTLVALAARHAIPAIYDIRDYAVDGGLISYSASLADAYRKAGVYAGRILNGEKPGDLPVLLPTKFELVVNLKTAKALGLTVPLSLQVAADEVID